MDDEDFKRVKVENGEPILQAALLLDGAIAALKERSETLEDQKEAGREGQPGEQRLEQVLRSVYSERKKMQRYLSQGDEYQVMASMKRLLTKIVRAQRRF